MRDELVTRVMADLNDLDDEIKIRIEQSLVKCLYDYDVTVRQTAIVPAESFIPQYFGVFIAKKMISGRAKGTLKLYNYYISDFFLHKPAPLDKMDTALMIRYLYDFQKRKNVCNSTLDSARIMLNTFFEWAYTEGYIKSNFVKNVDAIQYIEKIRNPLSGEDVELLREACKTDRERAIIDVLVATGVRISELINIKWNDIDMNEKLIVVFGKGSKFRRVVFDSRAKISLLRYKVSRNGDSPYVFVSDRKPYDGLKKAQMHNIIKAIAKRSGISAEVSAHIFRHTFATNALDRGMSLEKVKELLGHENCDTTLVYAKSGMSHIQHAYHMAFGN